MNGEHKITSSHRERTALIYLRQSSMAQVREHTESTRSQYALAGQGGRAGLAAQRHRGDRHRPGDLRQVGGGPGRVHRPGHQGLLRRCRGDLRDRDHPAGPVQRRRGPAGEFARITGTLLIDPSGVYHPADVNDRVLLGFKGTMERWSSPSWPSGCTLPSEAAAERGELRTPLPVGGPRRRRRAS